MRRVKESLSSNSLSNEKMTKKLYQGTNKIFSKRSLDWAQGRKCRTTIEDRNHYSFINDLARQAC